MTVPIPYYRISGSLNWAHDLLVMRHPIQPPQTHKNNNYLENWALKVGRFRLTVLCLQLLPPLGQRLLRDLDDDGRGPVGWRWSALTYLKNHQPILIQLVSYLSPHPSGWTWSTWVAVTIEVQQDVPTSMLTNPSLPMKTMCLVLNLRLALETYVGVSSSLAPLLEVFAL